MTASARRRKRNARQARRMRLAGMGVVRYLTDQKRRQTIVILAERQAPLSGSAMPPVNFTA